VAGHIDWRAENLRSDGERLCAAYDWESLRQTVEPALVGGAAFLFASDWHRPPPGRQIASIDEAIAFVGAYEEARGIRFDARDRRILGAAAAYAVAYVARCSHAVDVEGNDEPVQGFRSLIGELETELLHVFA